MKRPWVAVRVVAVFGWVLSLTALLVVGWIAPDEPTSASVRQGVAFAAVFAAVPTAAWARPHNFEYAIAAGFGWVVAGLVTMMGGNGPMALGAVFGLALAIAGETGLERVSLTTLGPTVVVALMLSVAVSLAGANSALSALGAVGLAGVIGALAFRKEALNGATHSA